MTFVCHFNMIYVDFSRPCAGVVFERFCDGFGIDLVPLLETIWALFLFFCGLIFSVFWEPLPDSTEVGNVAEKSSKR